MGTVRGAVVLQLLCFCAVTASANNRPVIGVLSQELPHSLQLLYPNATSYIAASYIKFLESGGARAVPILLNQPQDYYEHLFQSLNGVLFPGGAVSLENSGYAEVGKVFYDNALKVYQLGDYFPLWGTCLGFEFITRLAIGENWLTRCDSEDEAKPLHFTKGYLTSRMFQSAPDAILRILSEEPVTVNYHHFCMTPTNFTISPMASSYRYMSTNVDDYNVTFISSLENLELPIYGVQFHPEKNPFEWSLKRKGIPHSKEAILVAQYFADFFVNEARRSKHSFDSEEDLQKYLIYNYYPEYTGLHGSTFDQSYIF